MSSRVEVSAGASQTSLKYRWDRFTRKYAPYLFISPFYVLFLVFGTFPILFSLYLSFHMWDGIGPMKFVGLENYWFLLTDPWFWQSLWNTIFLGIISSIPQHLLALGLAFILNSGMVRFKEFFRTSFFLPYITSTVAIAIVFSVIFGRHFGALNWLLGSVANTGWFQWILSLFDLEFPINWLGSSKLIKPSIAILVIWKWTGWNMILYLAGLQAIPNELYEAARVDGATAWKTFTRITLPLLRPMMMFAVTMSVIGSMQIFDEPMMLVGQSGGTDQAGLTTVLYMYRTGFEWMQMGTAAAMSYLLFFVIMFFSFLNLKVFRRGDR